MAKIRHRCDSCGKFSHDFIAVQEDTTDYNPVWYQIGWCCQSSAERAEHTTVAETLEEQFA